MVLLKARRKRSEEAQKNEKLSSVSRSQQARATSEQARKLASSQATSCTTRSLQQQASKQEEARKLPRRTCWREMNLPLCSTSASELVLVLALRTCELVPTWNAVHAIGNSPAS